MARSGIKRKKTGLTPSNVDGDVFSIQEFCARHRISVKFFYKRPDLMPPTFYLGTRRLISKEVAAKWLQDRQAAAAADAEANAVKRKRGKAKP